MKVGMLLQFDDDLEEEATRRKPFWRRWKFYRNTFLFLFRWVQLCEKYWWMHCNVIVSI